MANQRITIFLTSILGFLTLLFTNHIREEKLQAFQMADASGAQGARGGGLVAFDDKNVSKSLLFDSVLAIVQNYYVDRNRIRGEELQRLALDYMRDEESATVQTGDKAVVVTKADKQVSLPVHTGIGFRELLRNVLQLSDLLERTDSQQKPEIAGKPTPPQAGVGAQARLLPPTQRFLNGLLSRLDPHSVFLDTDAYNELMQGTEGVFGGLGVVVGIRDNILTVIKPIPNSPAARAGVRKFDKIMRIGAVDTFGFSLDELVDYMRGAPGTSVNLALLRDGSLSPAEIKLTREVIQVQTVESKKIRTPHGQFLHVSIESFASRTAAEVATAIKQGLKETNGKLAGVILDLRSNPGGLLDQAVEVADLFLTEGAIVSTKGRREEVERAGFGLNEFNMPLAVLINPESASASEIVAGALQDNRRAVIIGQPSFGKGSVQTIFKLPGEQALKLTIARYYTPNGGSIQNIGIMPHIWVQPTLRAKNNENLLGDYRYRSERFLANHLEMSQEERLFQEKTRKNLVWKSYYMTDLAPDINDTKNDHELKLATDLLDEVAKVYGAKAPVETQRSSHWLALASQRLFKDLRNEEQGVQSYMASTHHVDWGANPSPDDGTAPKLSLEIKPKVVLDAGRSDGIPFTVANLDRNDVFRVSIYARPAFPGGGTYEILLGHLKKGERRSGVIPLSSFRAAGDSVFDMDVGLAMDATPIAAVNRKLKVQVNNRADVRLEAAFEFKDDTSLRVPSALEPREKARILVKLVNKGKRIIRNLVVTPYNLSGTQVTIGDAKGSRDPLKPGETREYEVKIQGGPQLLSSQLSMGVRVESEDLLGPSKFSYAYKAVPNMLQAAKEGLNAH